MTEIPITLHPDGRKSDTTHLRTFRDGWRTLRLYLIYSPRWLFLLPGLLMILLGLFGYALAMPGTTVRGVNFGAHTLLVASLATLCGYQAILFAVFTKTFAIGEGLLPEDPAMRRFMARFGNELGVIAGALAFLIGMALLVVAVEIWRSTGFGNLDYAYTLRWVIPGVMLCALGFQTVLSSFFLSILEMRRR